MTFNPLDLENLGESVAHAMSQNAAAPLAALPRFEGSGIYALYYSGTHPAYAPLVEANTSAPELHPVYVGRAGGKGSRKGNANPDSGTALRSRLWQHRGSIEAASNLDLADFQARWLVLEEVWVNLGEAVLIRKHSPVWNKIVDGFGNHAPGSGRDKTVRSRWDVLHPGRAWADGLVASRESSEDIAADVVEFLRQRV